MPISWLTDAGALAEPYEMHQTARESWTNEKLSADVDLFCPWADRTAVLDNILSTPLEWPYQPGESIYAVSGGIMPFPGEPGILDGNGYTWEQAKISVHFETLSLGSDPGGGGGSVIFSESIEPTAEFLSIPYQDYRWGSSSGTKLKPEEAPGKLLIGLDYVVTLYNYPSIPAWTLTLINNVNSASVVSASLGLTFAAQTLLFNPPRISRSVVFGGSNKYTIQTRYTYKPQGWNTFWRAESQSFVQMYHKDSGDVAYLNYLASSFAGAIP